jgi:multiple sugar transport system ATP-binding protein
VSDLKITGLHKHYGSYHAVKGIDLEVPSGEFTVLVGPSGCGKSTLLRTIAGLEEASAGTVEIGGKDVTWARPRDRDIAMVFQNYALYPYLNVYENIAFGLRARRVASAEVDKRVKRAAEMLGIAQLLERFPRELSGVSASALRSAARSCAMRCSSCSMNRSAISMPSFATTCGLKSSGSIRSSAAP